MSTPSKLKNDCYLKKVNKVASNHLSINELINIRHTHPNNSIIVCLNINSLRTKIVSLREVIGKAPHDIFCIDKTKLDESFLDLFQLKNYQFSPIS